MAVSSFFGFRPQQNLPVPVATESAVIAPSPESSPTATPTVRRVFTPTPTPTPSKPTTSITEEVLRKFLGQSEKASIDRILNDPSMLNTYEGMFYAKFKKFPIPRLDTKKTNAMPSKNGPVWCTGTQLASVYSDIEKTEKEYLYNQMDYDCHYNRSKAETKECQDWRRDNDKNRTGGTSNDMFMRSIEKNALLQRDAYDNLIEKYCGKK